MYVPCCCLRGGRWSRGGACIFVVTLPLVYQPLNRGPRQPREPGPAHMHLPTACWSARNLRSQPPSRPRREHPFAVCPRVRLTRAWPLGSAAASGTRRAYAAAVRRSPRPSVARAAHRVDLYRVAHLARCTAARHVACGRAWYALRPRSLLAPRVMRTPRPHYTTSPRERRDVYPPCVHCHPLSRLLLVSVQLRTAFLHSEHDSELTAE